MGWAFRIRAGRARPAPVSGRASEFRNSPPEPLIPLPAVVPSATRSSGTGAAAIAGATVRVLLLRANHLFAEAMPCLCRPLPEFSGRGR
jgi:hypothetical protein